MPIKVLNNVKRIQKAADIFLFTIGKSVDTLFEIIYDMLEVIKDGELFASKYDSQRITVNTPNTVMFLAMMLRSAKYKIL